MEMLKVFYGIDDMNFLTVFLYLLIIMVLEILTTIYIFNIHKHKGKIVCCRSSPVWNAKISQLIKCCTSLNNFENVLNDL